MNFDYVNKGSNEKIKLNIYYKSLADWIFDDDISFITGEIKKSEYTVEITMQEFAEAVMAGRYFTCGAYEDDWKE